MLFDIFKNSYHEVGHNLTYANKNISEIIKLKNILNPIHNNSVSKYGATNGFELIAEAFTKMMYGESISYEVKKLIKKHTEIK